MLISVFHQSPYPQNQHTILHPCTRQLRFELTIFARAHGHPIVCAPDETIHGACMATEGSYEFTDFCSRRGVP